MQSIAGQVSAFLYDSHGELCGMLLNGGQVVRFPGGQAHLVTLIVNVGSHVAVEGLFRSGGAAAAYLEAALITNFDYERSVTFLAPNRQDQPGMLHETTPNSPASLAYPDRFSGKHRTEEKLAQPTHPNSQDPCLHSQSSQPVAQPSPLFTKPHSAIPTFPPTLFATRLPQPSVVPMTASIASRPSWPTSTS